MLLLPSAPTKRSFELVQVDPAPVTNTLLFMEELALKPMYPVKLTTAPPLEITRMLLLPPLPT